MSRREGRDSDSKRHRFKYDRESRYLFVFLCMPMILPLFYHCTCKRVCSVPKIGTTNGGYWRGLLIFFSSFLVISLVNLWVSFQIEVGFSGSGVWGRKASFLSAHLFMMCPQWNVEDDPFWLAFIICFWCFRGDLFISSG